jgi:hypothetical protein
MRVLHATLCSSALGAPVRGLDLGTDPVGESLTGLLIPELEKAVDPGLEPVSAIEGKAHRERAVRNQKLTTLSGELILRKLLHHLPQEQIVNMPESVGRSKSER